MEFTFESAGERLISRRLDRYAGRAIKAKPAFELIERDTRGWEKDLFKTDGASGGDPWAPLAPSTVKAKAQAGLDPRVLQATRALRKSLTVKSDPEHEEIITDDFLVFGSKLDYAGYHQKGRGVPKRRPLQFTEMQKRAVVKRLQRWIVEAR